MEEADLVGEELEREKHDEFYCAFFLGLRGSPYMLWAVAADFLTGIYGVVEERHGCCRKGRELGFLKRVE